MKLNLTILLFIIAQGCFSQSNVQRLDSLLIPLFDSGKLNGNVLIAEKGKVIYSRSFGLANETTKEKLTENSVFELASVSKQFTAMAIVILEEKGKLSYEDKITKYIPELSMYGNVTIANLLHHTGGLPAYEPLMDSLWDHSKIATNKDIIALFSKHKPKALFEPNADWQYSNTGYAMLASIIEKVSGMAFGDYLNKVIFKPLKMNHTLVYCRRYAPKKVEHYAYGYVYNYSSKTQILPDDHADFKYVIWLDGIVGDGTVNSTVEDLLKWDRALYTNKLISEASKKRVFSAPEISIETAPKYGFGWFIEDGSSYGKLVNHSGGWPGYRTYIERQIDQDKTIIILENHEDGYMPIRQIRSILYNKSFPDPKKAIKVPDNILSKYEGLYRVEDRFTIVIKKADGYYLFAEGQYSKMYFSSETDFFNVEFPTEKHFISDASGNVTGYQRTLDGVPQSSLEKIYRPDTIKGSETFFNYAGWTFLENKKYKEAILCLSRGLELYPRSLAIKGNLAHCFLFNNEYSTALKMYKAHLNETVNGVLIWNDMIKQDFEFFNNSGFDKSLMDKIVVDLHW